MLQLQNNNNMLGDLKTDALNVSITHIQPRIYVFSWTVSLFGSSRSTEMYLGGEELRFDKTVFRSAYKEVEMVLLHQ